MFLVLLVFLLILFLFALFKSFYLCFDLLHLEGVVVDLTPCFKFPLLDEDQRVLHHLQKSLIFWSRIYVSSDTGYNLFLLVIFFLHIL